MNRDREALLPCPFCQGAAEVIERENPMSKWRWSVDCASSQCGMSGPVTASKPDAISAWNVRALSPTTLGGEIQGRLAAKDGAAAPPQAPVEVLSRLVSQLSKADWTDDHGHNLVWLQAFIEAKAFVENNNAT